ncbi:NifB/NifX family molybdenum-iron cluster-binding protein [Desulfurella sp.]|uniref:NifB/NifX family molybdenum-iron cluster-binding protein n=1 Tax=Desulfurella sp. TaxID=1962857 RepID=UPI003D0DEB2B
MKIAVPVKDNSLEIFPRTGQAPYFAIFNDSTFSHLIKNLIEEHEEKEEDSSKDHVEFHRKQVEALGDIDAVLVLKIGKHIKQALEEKNIQIIEFPNSDYKNAKELIENYFNNKK